MNTKFFFLLLVFLLATLSTASVSLHGLRATGNAESGTVVHKEKKVDDLPIDLQAPKVPHEPQNVHHDEKTPLQPEDGKHHHFHFGRLAGIRRRRELCHLACKVILFIGHVACFLYCILHAFH